MMNPLLTEAPLPLFDQIEPHHVEPAVDQALEIVRTRIEQLLGSNQPYSWDTLAEPVEVALEQLNRLWSPIAHLNAVADNAELRAAYNLCLPKISAFETELGQNEELYQAFRQIAENDAFVDLDTAQRKAIKNRLRDFRLTGIELESGQRKRFKEIRLRLSELHTKFRENLLDATKGWSKHLCEDAMLAGLPESAHALARQNAESENLEGWLLNLDVPSYFPVITYADDRALRKEIYTAYVTRASECGPHAGRWDNSPVMEETLELRHEAARLLGFANFGEHSLETKMAGSTDQVIEFLNDLAKQALPQAHQELAEIRDFAREQGVTYTLEAWDIPYYSEKLRQQRYALSQEELKPWFPEHQVVAGLFAVVQRLYGIEVKEQKNAAVWSPDVRLFEIHDEEQRLRGRFYLDLYTRPGKQGGAWMGECRTRLREKERLDVPVAYLTCNFTPPLGDQPSLFTHNEVITLFHEFGHGLHHLLSAIDYPSVSGINGVAWDAVELPSQIMENWCWERETLDLIASHYQTGEPLPEELFAKMRSARTFQCAMQMVRQIEFSLFDMLIHVSYDPAQGGRIYNILEQVRNQVAVFQPPAFNRFAHGFSHIFGGGYAAGYYSYKWAEVLSSDAYSLFEENGIFDRATGQRFRREILERGGSEDPMQLFAAFRGRQPTIEALLRHSGLALTASMG